MITQLLSTMLLFAIPYEHQITTILDFGQKVELEDGSHWQVDSPDIYKTVYWNKEDTVILTPYHSWFPFYNFGYCLTNATQNSSARVNLAVAPVPFATTSHWITSMDKYGGFLFLDDGTCWKISSSDNGLFQEWSINDYIIVGHNDEWQTSFPYLFINVRLKNHVRATTFSTAK